MKMSLILISLITITLTSLSNADNHPNTSFKVTEISPSLKLLQGKGGNIALSTGDDGLLIIDSGRTKWVLTTLLPKTPATAHYVFCIQLKRINEQPLQPAKVNASGVGSPVRKMPTMAAAVDAVAI